MPWNSVIKASVMAMEFWDRELKDPALEWKVTQGRTPVHIKRQAEDRGRSESPSKRPRGNFTDKGGRGRDTASGHDAKRGDGRYYRTHDGAEICYEWSRYAQGCADVCP